jgi:hypothetical protein
LANTMFITFKIAELLLFTASHISVVWWGSALLSLLRMLLY